MADEEAKTERAAKRKAKFVEEAKTTKEKKRKREEENKLQLVQSNYDKTKKMMRSFLRRRLKNQMRSKSMVRWVIEERSLMIVKAQKRI